MTLKIYIIPNIERITSLVKKSWRHMHLCLFHNATNNLKKDDTAVTVLKQEREKYHGEEIQLLYTTDYFDFVNVMMGDCV